MVVTNTIETYSNSALTFLNDGMVRFLINVGRTFIVSKMTFNNNYFEQGPLNNFITFNFGWSIRSCYAYEVNPGERKSVFHVKNNADISYLLNVLVEIMQF